MKKQTKNEIHRTVHKPTPHTKKSAPETHPKKEEVVEKKNNNEELVTQDDVPEDNKKHDGEPNPPLLNSIVQLTDHQQSFLRAKFGNIPLEDYRGTKDEVLRKIAEKTGNTVEQLENMLQDA